MFGKRLIGLGAALAVFGACTESPTQIEVLESSLTGVAAPTVKMVPFHATNDNAQLDPTAVVCPAGEIVQRNAITGQGTHLGTFTGEVIGCIGSPSGTYSRTDVTYVAANGDQLNFEMDPSFPGQIIVFTGLGNPIVVVGGLNVAGGTGRFAGATGHATFRSEGIFGVPGSAVTTTTGQISSRGSIKWATP